MRDRERETDGQTDRQTDRQRQRQTDRQADRQRQKQRQRQREVSEGGGVQARCETKYRHAHPVSCLLGRPVHFVSPPK